MSNYLTKISYILRRYYNGRMCKEKKPTIMIYWTRKFKCWLPLRVWYYITDVYIAVYGSCGSALSGYDENPLLTIEHAVQNHIRFAIMASDSLQQWKPSHTSPEMSNFTANGCAYYFYTSFRTGPIIAFNYTIV